MNEEGKLDSAFTGVNYQCSSELQQNQDNSYTLLEPNSGQSEANILTEDYSLTTLDNQS